MMVWALIGTAVGTTLGITGAGGAVLAVPLFIYLTGATLHEATTASLLAVLAGASFNWLLQRRHTDWGTSVAMASLSTIGSLFASSWKQSAPSVVIQGLFATLCLFSLYATWKARGKPRAAEISPTGARIAKAGASGVFLGAITTLTGLGGGVILVPWLTGPLGFAMDKAVATSLLTIFLTALISLSIQWGNVAISPLNGVGLLAGTILAGILIRALLRRLPAAGVQRLRQWTLTVVLVAAIVSILGRA